MTALLMAPGGSSSTGPGQQTRTDRDKHAIALLLAGFVCRWGHRHVARERVAVRRINEREGGGQAATPSSMVHRCALPETEHPLLHNAPLALGLLYYKTAARQAGREGRGRGGGRE